MGFLRLEEVEQSIATSNVQAHVAAGDFGGRFFPWIAPQPDSLSRVKVPPEEIMRKPILVSTSVVLVLAAVILALGTSGFLWPAPQDKSKRPSPPEKAECKLDGKTVTVDYSSPRAKGRKVFGGLVPFGQVWRAGANEATTFVTDTDIKVGGTPVPAGKYTVFTIPNENKWTLIISKKTGEWGTAYPGPDNDLARIDMKVSKLPSPVENFTIAFDHSGNGCVMHLDWETTRASAEITK